MNTFISWILITCFAIISIFLIIKSYVKQQPIHSEVQSKNSISAQLQTLESDASPEQKADAFITLMILSYVLVHTLMNKGNNYNDEKQSKLFCNSLTPDMLKQLNSVEANYG